ncbi:MAG TPA: nucleotidyltransferase family protein [Dehalococcoidales bacterium]|nr:nucleotidyltransferase family protein [Dehalococcoidales bacterium]
MKRQNILIETILEKLRQFLPELERRYRVKSLGIFGSYVRGEQKKASDLDLLVEFFEPPSLLKFIELKNCLSDRLEIKVDLVMKEALKPAIGKKVLDEVIAV